MQKVRLHLEGQQIGNLKIICRHKKIGKYYYWYCECRCGRKKAIRQDHLRAKETLSCGCLQLFKVKTHGEAGKTVEYRTWFHMNQRCRNSHTNGYKNYGGRGIKVCSRWKGKNGYKHFLMDMGRRFGSHYSLDRINNDGDYTPSNCRWATAKEQSNNKRNTKLYATTTE